MAAGAFPGSADGWADGKPGSSIWSRAFFLFFPFFFFLEQAPPVALAGLAG